jgi:hypothetical protein
MTYSTLQGQWADRFDFFDSPVQRVVVRAGAEYFSRELLDNPSCTW